MKGRGANPWTRGRGRRPATVALVVGLAAAAAAAGQGASIHGRAVDPAGRPLPLDAPLRIELAPGVALAGSVRDADGAPAAGVTVGVEGAGHRAPRAEVETDAEGRFAFDGLVPGTATVDARGAPGWAGPLEIDLSLERPPAPLAIVLEPAAAIRGRAFAAAGVERRVELVFEEGEPGRPTSRRAPCPRSFVGQSSFSSFRCWQWPAPPTP